MSKCSSLPRSLLTALLGFSLGLLSCTAFAGEEAPPLPEGLGEAPQAESTDTGQSPALPEGLGGGESSGPSLPEGLGGESAATGESPAEGPQLPEGLGDQEASAGQAETEEQPKRLRPEWLHGFWDMRGGVRTQNDPAQSKDATLGEVRLQLEAEKVWDNAVLKYRGDFIGDGVLEQGDYDPVSYTHLRAHET